MVNYLDLKKLFILFASITIFIIPALVFAGGGSHGRGCCSGSRYYGYQGPYYYQNYATSSSRIANLYGLSSFPTTSSIPIYPYSRYSSLVSPYYSGWPAGTNYLGGVGTQGLYSPWSQQQVVSGKDYTVAKSYTQYVPGGEVTTTVEETTGTASIPQATPWMYYSTYPYSAPYSYSYVPASYGFRPTYSNYYVNPYTGWY